MIGRLDRRVTLLAPGSTQNTYGEVPSQYDPSAMTTWATVWGMLMGISGRERVGQAAFISDAQYRLRIRHKSGVSPKMAAEIGGKRYKVLAVIEVGRKRWMDLYLAEVA